MPRRSLDGTYTGAAGRSPTLQVPLASDLLERFRAAAGRRKLTAAELAREVLTRWLARDRSPEH